MLQNRVDPWGKLCAVADRGSLMGNRGILHDANNEIVHQWRHKNWVTCLLKYKDIQRPKPFSQGNYSELFFLDEATAMSAGHRPCNFCQRNRLTEFKNAWVAANQPDRVVRDVSMNDVDAVLHGERVDGAKSKRTYRAVLETLPVGTFFEYASDAYAVTQSGVRKWSFSGYSEVIKLDMSVVVQVLTPPSIVKAFAYGFVPRMAVDESLT